MGGVGGVRCLDKSRRGERQRLKMERERDAIEKERWLLACRGRSRISYAQEAGVIKIDMGCIRPGHVQLTSHKS